MDSKTNAHALGHYRRDLLAIEPPLSHELVEQLVSDAAAWPLEHQGLHWSVPPSEG
jgi:hypothetical protein